MITYSTSSAGLTDNGGDDLANGVVIDVVVTARGTVRLYKFYSSDTDSGLEYEVHYESLERCDEECRWEPCSHYDRDVEYRFDSEAVAVEKFSYLVRADQG